MTPVTDQPRFTLLGFLRQELAPKPGRLAAVSRITFNCTLVVAIAMLFQIPLPSYMAYIVFLGSREETASTLLTCVVAALSISIAVAVSLLFYTLDASEPALRLPLMAASAFIGIFLARTIALGPVAFLVSFLLVLSQTLIDRIPSLEALTRLVLWLWVVALVPITVTVVVNFAIGESPSKLAKHTAVRLLGVLAIALRGDHAGSLQDHLAAAVGLLELRQHAGMLDHDLRGRTAVDTELIELLVELLALHDLLPAGTAPEARLVLAEIFEDCAAALKHDTAPTAARRQMGATSLAGLPAQLRPVIIAMFEAATKLSDGIDRRRTAADQIIAAPPKSIFVPDAFSNPGHSRFALKTTIAIMTCYVLYSGLDWSGISTSITTCFFVALNSLGETMHKLTLRLAGAVSGGLIGALTIVYLLPGMEDIGQLLLLIAAVAAVGAWIATSSELLAYAGMQMAFAFFIGVLQGYGPATDLTGLRDRVVGILLGNVVMSVIFSTLWPSSAVDQAYASVASALRSLGKLLTSDAPSKAGSRLAVVRLLGEARRLAGVATFEVSTVPAGGHGGLSLAAVHRLAAATFVVLDQPAGTRLPDSLQRQDQATAAWFAASADELESGTKTFAGRPPPLDGAIAAPPDALRTAVEARLLLQAEIEDVVTIRT